MRDSVSIYVKAREYGKAVINPATSLANFATDAARAVIAGEIDAEDAERLYLAYYDSTIKRSGAQSQGSHKVQVSKLRQIMKLAEEYPRECLKLLSQVTEMQRTALADNKSINALYICLVDAARTRRESAKPLTAAQLRKIVFK